MSYFRRALTVVITAGALAQPAAAQTVLQDLDALDALIATAVGADPGTTGGAMRPVDRRLRLRACPDTPIIEPPTRGAVVVRCGANGWRLSVALVAEATPGAANAAAVASTEYMVRRGDQVRVIVQGQGFSVSTSGVADQDAVVGQRARVRIDGHPRPVFGTVMADGRIRL